MRAKDGNLFDDIPETSAPKTEAEIFTDLLSAPGLKVERIISLGHVTPADFWYDQAWSEWVMVASGAAAVLFEGEAEPHRLKAGDYLFIPPHQRHQVIWTEQDEPTIWLAIHFGDLP